MRCENISTGRLDYYVENSEAVFIDLRSRQEYEKMHIKGAVNIPFEEMEQQLQNNYRNRNVNMNTNMNTNINTNMNTNIKNSAGGIVLNNIFYDRNTVFIVYCDRGSKSMMICPKLAARGFQVKTVVGGIHQYHGKYLVYHKDFYKDF